MKLGKQYLLPSAALALSLFNLYFLRVCGQVPDDVRQRVQSTDEAAQKSQGLIEIGKTIFGHPFGESEDEFIAKEGKPDGYLSLANRRAVLVYGNKTGFIFDEGKLNGIRISHSIFDWVLSQQIDRPSRFDHLPWRTSKGLRENLSEESLKTLFGNELLQQDHHYLYQKDDYFLRIDMATTINPDGLKGAKNVSSILLTKE